MSNQNVLINIAKTLISSNHHPHLSPLPPAGEGICLAILLNESSLLFAGANV
jgi:hypothetical protein